MNEEPMVSDDADAVLLRAQRSVGSRRAPAARQVVLTLTTCLYCVGRRRVLCFRISRIIFWIQEVFVSLGFSSKRVLYFVSYGSERFLYLLDARVFVSFWIHQVFVSLEGSHPRGFRIFWIRQVFVDKYVLITDSIVRTYFVDRVRRSRIHDGFRPWSMSILLDGWVDECGSRSLPNQPQPHNPRTMMQQKDPTARRTKQQERRAKASCQADSRSPQHSSKYSYQCSVISTTAKKKSLWLLNNE